MILIVKIHFHILYSITDIKKIWCGKKTKTSLADQEGKKRQDQTMDRQDQGNHQQLFSSFIESFYQIIFLNLFWFPLVVFLPVRVPEHHAGERAVDQHLPEVVRIPTSREKTIGDETAAGAQNKVLLQKF